MSEEKKRATKPGRPTKLNEKTVSLLESYIQSGWSITETCYSAKISRDTFYSWAKENKQFSDRMHEASNHILRMAKKNLLAAVLRGDLKASMWIMNKYSDDVFSPDTEDDILATNEITIDEASLYELQELITFQLTRQFIAKKYSTGSPRVTENSDSSDFSVRQHRSTEQLKDYELLKSLDVIPQLLKLGDQKSIEG